MKQTNKKPREAATPISEGRSLQAEGTSVKTPRRVMPGVPGCSQEASVHRAECEKREKRRGSEVREELWDADHVRP